MNPRINETFLSPVIVLVCEADDLLDLVAAALDAVVVEDAVVLLLRQEPVPVRVRSL